MDDARRSNQMTEELLLGGGAEKGLQPYGML